jgi:hypothetical protein
MNTLTRISQPRAVALFEPQLPAVIRRALVPIESEQASDLLRLADYVERSRHFNMNNELSCINSHAWDLKLSLKHLVGARAEQQLRYPARGPSGTFLGFLIGGPYGAWGFTGKQAAKVIRHLAATGRVDWRVGA